MDNIFANLLAVLALIGFGYFIYTRVKAKQNRTYSGSTGGTSGKDNRRNNLK